MVSRVISRNGGVARGVADRLAQVGQRLAQVGARRGVGQLGPQQPDQRIALVRPVGLDRQVGQQGARFVVREAADRLPIQRDPHGSQQGEWRGAP